MASQHSRPKPASTHAPRGNRTHDPGRFRVFVSLGAFKHASLIRRGLKLTADDANETATEMLLREVQQPHRAFCSSKGQRHVFDE